MRYKDDQLMEYHIGGYIVCVVEMKNVYTMLGLLGKPEVRDCLGDMDVDGEMCENGSYRYTDWIHLTGLTVLNDLQVMKNVCSLNVDFLE
jgi:hypothetical protein